MEKTFKLISVIALLAAMCLTACNKVEPTEDPIDEPGKEVTQGWTVAISATMGSDASTKALTEDSGTHNLIATFETTDNIYVYNATKKVVDANPLHPDKNGASAVLTGTLAGDYDKDDELVLCYNSNNSGTFVYNSGQKGTISTVKDYAKAEIIITAADAASKSITGTADFVNMQSIFSFNFTDGSMTVPVKALQVSTDGSKLVSQYGVRQNDLNPVPYSDYGQTSIVTDDPISGTVYVALRNDNEADDTYHFMVNDGAGHLYKGEKAAPTGKIVNGKHYSSTVTLTPVALPTVKLTASGTPVGPNAAWDESLVKLGWSNLTFGYANYGDLTISGNSNGSWFEWLTDNSSGGDRTVTLDGATITEPDGGKIPLENQDGGLTLILSGDNSITTTGSPAIAFNGSAIHFQGNGTLTITAATSEVDHSVKGIKGSDTTPSPTAASGYVLTVSEGVDNGDGTSTWVYTVRSTTSGSAEITGGATQEWVQLWADGPKWAKFNVGSTITTYAGVTAYTNPDVVGGYYSYRGSKDSVPDSQGTTDTATYVWGNNWQTPTKEQEQALLDNCTWEFVNGTEGHQFEAGCTLAGWKVSGKEAGYTGNSIFLPNAGVRNQNANSREDVGSRGVYWSSTAGGYGAYYLNLGYASGKGIRDHNKPHGCSVRAIYVGAE